MFVSQRWWASQRQSNGGILEVRPPKIKWHPEISKDLYFFDNHPFTD
jgi:hypothetical protein